MSIWTFLKRVFIQSTIVGVCFYIFFAELFFSTIRKPSSFFKGLKELPSFARDMGRGWKELVFYEG